MKTIIRIPTEQYAFVEVEMEVESMDEAVDNYRRMSKLYRGGTGLPDKEFNAFLDRYLLGEDNHIEEYEQMNEDQKFIVQAVKRSLKRIKARQQ